MSNCINDMIWEEIWEQIKLDEATLDAKHLDRVSNLSIEHGLHEDDDREKILELLAEEIMEERAV